MARHRHGIQGHQGHRRGRRFFRSGELHLVLLALIERRPRHGYELMDELSGLFGPAYTPSPGSIYPALTALEDEGLVEPTTQGDRKVFNVTDTGRAALTDRADMLASVEARTGVGLTGGSLEGALARLTARVRAVAGDVDRAKVERILDEAGNRIERLSEEGAHP